MLRPPVTECSTYRPVDAFDDEALEHRLGVDGSASELPTPDLLHVVGCRQNLMLECLNVDVNCSNILVCREPF